MPNKTLKITFSGICILTPSDTSNPEKLEKVYVAMPANREANSGIGEHKAFAYIPTKHLVSAPEAAYPVADDDLGRCSVYLLDHARITISPDPMQNPRPQKPGPRYVVFPDLEVRDRPGPTDIAPRNDIRWTAALHEFLGSPPPFRVGCDPSKNSVSTDLAMVVEITGGAIRAHFPCATVQPQRFRLIQGDTLLEEVEARVYASEFVVEMTYPEKAEDVRLKLAPLSQDTAVTGVGADELVLRWQNGRIDLRMGNDTEEEIKALRDLKRCDIRPIPRTRDTDFRLHYNVYDVKEELRAVPAVAGLHTQHNGCLGIRG